MALRRIIKVHVLAVVAAFIFSVQWSATASNTCDFAFCVRLLQYH